MMISGRTPDFMPKTPQKYAQNADEPCLFPLVFFRKKGKI